MSALKIKLQDIQVDLPGSGKTLFQFSHFAVEAGRKVLLQGESGKGKTTLLHLMAGLFYPSRGSVEVGDQCLTKLNDEARCRFRRQNIGIIFQKLNLIEHLTALENVVLALPGDPAAKAKARAALEAVGLATKAWERSSVLSLGEQQRVAVARVLAGPSKIILADEPTSSLDEKNSVQVMELLFHAAREKTLLVVSHDHRIRPKFDQQVDFAQVIGS